jgi:hypothetical protein
MPGTSPSPPERGPVADGAVDGLAFAGRHQRRAFDVAADRNVIDEAGFGIAGIGPRLVLRQHDDPLADRLATAIRHGEAHAVNLTGCVLVQCIAV